MRSLLPFILLVGCAKVPPRAPTETDPVVRVAHGMAVASSIAAFSHINASEQGDATGCFAYGAAASATGAAADILIARGALYPGFQVDLSACLDGALEGVGVSPMVELAIDAVLREVQLLIAVYGDAWPCEAKESAAAALAYVRGAVPVVLEELESPDGVFKLQGIEVRTCDQPAAE